MANAVLDSDSTPLPLKNPFTKGDWVCGFIVGILAFFVYAWTAAPNVTLEDSGEFIVAAEHFGVPHPSGYALWTVTAWLFSRLPLGNAAWEIALYSGVCGALSMGIAGMLLSSSLRYMLKDMSDSYGDIGEISRSRIAWILAVAFGLCSAYNVSLWSQSVIVEVYAMHTLLTFLFLTAVYLWVHNHDKMWLFVPVLFFYSLGLSNHHLTLPFMLVIIVLLLLLKLNYFFEFFSYLLLSGAGVYGLFAFLSDNPETPFIDDAATQKTAIRFAIFAVMFLLVVWRFQKRLPYWRQGIGIIIAVFIGLSPYLYQPLASSTNPPMNWGYNRTKAGFFYSINRSQYSGSLSTHLIRTVGKSMGSAPLEEAAAQGSSAFNLKASQFFAAIYWKDVCRNFSFFMIFLFMGAFVCMLFLEYERRIWILFLYVVFLIAAFLQALMYPLGVDKGGWEVQLPFHTVSFSLIPFVSAMSAAALSYYFIKKFSLSSYWLLLCLLFPIVPLVNNYNLCSQRNHWFGWHFGHDMLVDLPKNSVVYGGSDPGRFIPTYMIFGESFQDSKFKKNPNFDRRDLYIITQNALADDFYQNYIHDHYSDKRPKVVGWFEKWLGRENMYPKDPLILPSKEEIGELIRGEVEKAQREGKSTPYMADPFFANAVVAEWIFNKNKAKHRFFVEESAPMPWSYPYAIPHGLCYEINPEPISKLSQESVAKDMEFWKKYKQFLLASPEFRHDSDAQRDFAKLRMTMGNIYRFRNMDKEAEIAYRDALELCPYNADAIAYLTKILVERGEQEEAVKMVENALNIDPLSLALQTIARTIALSQVERELEAKFASNPKDEQAVSNLLKFYKEVRNDSKADTLVEYSIDNLTSNPKMFEFMINFYIESQRFERADYVCERWVKKSPENPEAHYLMSRLYLTRGNMEYFYKSAEKALKFGGMTYRQRYLEDPLFDSLRFDPKFMGMVGTFHSTTENEPRAKATTSKAKR